MATSTRELMEKALVPGGGLVVWIGLRPAARQAVISVEEVEANADSGLVGDHFQGPNGAVRQVTLIQQEHIDIVSKWLGKPSLDPALMRRNIVVSGLNLLALKGRHFRVGEALLRGTGPCAPCQRMEENLGRGGFQAMRGHGGITASIVQSGRIRIGDRVAVADD